MDWDLNEEHRLIRQTAREFAREVVAPGAIEREQTGEYPYDIIAQMAELGMMGLPFPEKYGGAGGDWVGTMICIEEISRADVTLGALLDVTVTVAGQEVLAFGTEEQKRKYLIPLARGKEIGAFGLTEPDAGSDAGSIRTTAVLEGDEWVLNGTKMFITNIGLDNATVMMTAARINLNGQETIATFIVPKDSPGFSLGKRLKKMGWAASATHEVILEDCRIPAENLLGDPSKGFSQHLSVLEAGRISIAAMSVGLAQACLDESLKYARDRRAFGRPIFDFQGVGFKLADMAVNIELARNQYLKAAWLKDMGRSHTFETTAAKLFASEVAEKAASDAVQIHGGYGYMEEFPVCQYFKQCKVLQIVEGTSEIHRLIISRLLSGPRPGVRPA